MARGIQQEHSFAQVRTLFNKKMGSGRPGGLCEHRNHLLQVVFESAPRDVPQPPLETLHLKSLQVVERRTPCPSSSEGVTDIFESKPLKTHHQTITHLLVRGKELAEPGEA